jgi:hypothetical protein
MKVILSRKGFDSSNGGIVSPIFEDGTLISFPIPSDDKDTFSDLQYEGISYSDILLDLHYRGKSHCHVDPDLDQNKRKTKVDGWVPAFGQINQSAVYLKNNGIREGDLYDMYEMQEKEKDSRDGKLKEIKLTSIKEKVMNQKGSWIGTNVEWTE